EHALIQYALERLAEVPDLKLYGPVAPKKGAVATFSMTGIHAHDIAQLLDAEGIAIRAGHHCAMPLHQCLGIPVNAVVSFYLYNNIKEIDALIKGLYKAKKTFTSEKEVRNVPPVQRNHSESHEAS